MLRIVCQDMIKHEFQMQRPEVNLTKVAEIALVSIHALSHNKTYVLAALETELAAPNLTQDK